MNPKRQPERSPERGETAWKWLLRALGVVGFAFLLYQLERGADVPSFYYALEGGLLGLSNVIERQRRANREREHESDSGARR